MSLLTSVRRIYAYNAPVDMRKGFVGLESLVRSRLERDPLTGDVYVFVSRSGKHLKCLLWDRTGYVILFKKLERGKFQFHGQAQRLELDEQRLGLLLDGIQVAGVPTPG